MRTAVIPGLHDPGIRRNVIFLVLTGSQQIIRGEISGGPWQATLNNQYGAERPAFQHLSR